MRRGVIFPGAFALACLVLASCGSSPKQVQPLAITSISPSSLPAGSPGFQLTISGTDLTSGTFFSFGADSKIAPFLVLQDQCPTAPCPQTAFLQIPPNDIAAAGTAKVIANTEGENSNAVTFAITSPQVVTMSPLAATAGGPAFNLTLEVLNAGQSVQVLFGKDPTPLVPAGPVTCNPVTACAVTVTVPAADIKTAGPLTVTVANPFATAGGTVNTNFLVVNPGAGPFPALESVNGTTPGNGDSTDSSTSDGGVLVAFDSTATNLPGSPTSTHGEIYLTANCFGAPNCTPGTSLVTVGMDGSPGSGGAFGSVFPAISPDGRYVAFESDDTNLLSGSTTGIEQVYLRDTCSSIFGPVSSCTPKTTLISADPNGNPGNALSTIPSISAFGTYVAFGSKATNLTSASVPANTVQAYLYKSCSALSGVVPGCTPELELLSYDQNGNPGDKVSGVARTDPLGVAVAFDSIADNIVPGIAGNGAFQVYLRPTCLEAVPFLGPCTQPAVLVSADSGNNPGTADSGIPAVAAGGGLIVYDTTAPNLLPVSVSPGQILGRNTCLGLPGTTQCAPSGNIVLSVDTNGVAGTAPSSNAAISGTTVAFTSQALLVPAVTRSENEVYSVNFCLPPTGSCTPSTTLLSIGAGGAPLNAVLGRASVGAGAFVTFSSPVNTTLPITNQIFLAIPPPAPGAGPIAKLRKSKPE